MGLLMKGKWDDDATIPSDDSGRFIREASRFRHWVTEDGTPGPSGEGGFNAEPGRYHLFVSPSCPWAHRTIIMRKLKKLEDVISMSVADRPKTEGWSYSQGIDDLKPGADGCFRLHQVYSASQPDYTGKVTVPTLWDRKRRRVVNNESSEIIRMFNSSFNAWTEAGSDFYPEDMRKEIDEVNLFVYDHLNNGVYRAGFARTQKAYDEAVRRVFQGLDGLEDRLGKGRYLVGERLTEADWRAFPTLLRFDLVYYSHFKCNLRRLQDYPNLANYLRELYQRPGIKDTFDLEKIKAGYYSQRQVNPTGIVPLGPSLDHLELQHDRERIPATA
ncbi:MAG TPA: glutathione S-transferase family protein [Candidatus Binatia bacterium]